MIFCSECEHLIAGDVTAPHRKDRPKCGNPDNVTKVLSKTWLSETEAVEYKLGPHKRNIDNNCGGFAVRKEE